MEHEYYTLVAEARRDDNNDLDGDINQWAFRRLGNKRRAPKEEFNYVMKANKR